MGKYPTVNRTSSPSATDRAGARSGAQVVLDAVLRALAPLVRLLLRHGVTYTAFAAALKPVFLQVAQQELAARGMARTDSALTLLSGVHRRDVRRLLRGATDADEVGFDASLGVVAEVVGRWMSDPAWLGPDDRPRRLPRSGAGSFDTLVASVSQDVRPRAVLDELLRLGAAQEVDDGVALLEQGFAPRQGLPEMAAVMAANVHDHAAAVAANLQGEANFLEQAVYVDALAAPSVDELAKVARKAWARAFREVMHTARQRFDADRAAPSGEAAAPTHRARFGVYFYSEPEIDP